jgi:predicted transcriptional regulator
MTKRKMDPILEYSRRMARILFAIDYLGRYCSICKMDGFDFPWLMDFHHKDQSTKKYEVKNKLYGGSFANHKEEIDKCTLTCVSCHRQEHAKFSHFQENKKTILEMLETIKNNPDGKITKNHFLSDVDKENIISLVNKNYIMTEIAKELNLNYGTIKSFVKRNKLDPNKRFRIKLPKSIIIKLLNQKYSLRGISEKININRETLRKFVNNDVVCETLSNGVKIYSLAMRNKISP